MTHFTGPWAHPPRRQRERPNPAAMCAVWLAMVGFCVLFWIGAYHLAVKALANAAAILELLTCGGC